VVVQRQPDLLEVVLALRPGRRLAHLMNRRQQEADEDGDDGDHHQQFDQRERGPGETRTFQSTPPSGDTKNEKMGRAAREDDMKPLLRILTSCLALSTGKMSESGSSHE